MKTYIKFFLLITIISFMSCEDPLEEKVYSELAPTNFLNTEEGIKSVLYSAYRSAQLADFSGGIDQYYLSAMPSGESWNRGGTVENALTPLSNFTWNSNHGYLNTVWNLMYEAIRDANILLDNIENENFSQEFKTEVTAEAKFIRASAYDFLYKWFGPTPIHNSSTPEELNLPRSTEEEMLTFIEQDYLEAAADLPQEQELYGMATKGSALGLLTKFYLNTKQWQKAAETAKEVMDMGKYGLVSSYEEVFSLENEGNKEMVWVFPRTAQIGGGNFINAFTFPIDYPRLPNQNVFAARTYMFDEFVNSFEESDSRLDLIVTEYTNNKGNHVQLLGKDQSLSLKYEFDPNAVAAHAGNDIPVVRYADILLARAEALNEMNGPNAESIELINQVRERAGASPLSVGDFTKESLRDHILQERAWEFFAEIKRREDQIRHGEFISGAQARGKNAQPHHVLFPIPQREIDANPNIDQNPGY